MASAQELFLANRKHSTVNLPVKEQMAALGGIRKAFTLEATKQLYSTAYSVWLGVVWQAITDPNCPTLFDGGDRSFDRARNLRLAGNLLASSNRLFTVEHKNPDGFHQTLHGLGILKDAIEENKPLSLSTLSGSDSSDCIRFTLDDPESNKSFLQERIAAADLLINGPMTPEEMHGLRRGTFRDLMHAYQLLAMVTNPDDKTHLHYLAAYQNIRENYDYLDKTRKFAKHPKISLSEVMKVTLHEILTTIHEALI